MVRTCDDWYPVSTLEQSFTQTFRKTVVECLPQLRPGGPTRLFFLRSYLDNVFQ